MKKEQTKEELLGELVREMADYLEGDERTVGSIVRFVAHFGYADQFKKLIDMEVAEVEKERAEEEAAYERREMEKEMKEIGR